jgi:hypothetical protein
VSNVENVCERCRKPVAPESDVREALIHAQAFDPDELTTALSLFCEVVLIGEHYETRVKGAPALSVAGLVAALRGKLPRITNDASLYEQLEPVVSEIVRQANLTSPQSAT